MVAEMPGGMQQQQLQQENAINSNDALQRPKMECPEPCTSGNGNNGEISVSSSFSFTTNNNENGPYCDGGENTQKSAEEKQLDLCVCTGCHLPIHDRYLYKVLDHQFYHEKCLHCSVCGEPFLGGSCFSREAKLFCRQHFVATFGPKCSRCAQPIGERSVVRRANQHIYHLECFHCVVCKRELNTGDQFYLIPMDGKLVCRQDYENAQKESAEMDCGNKRPRTTISAKSLETLKQAYQCSSKPARHVREQLAAQTGLDMRVVQVWFQNRRAKEKRLKKDASRRWAAGQIAAANGQALEGRSASNGSGGPGSVPSSGCGMAMFGRTGTLDSDSGASGNDAESPRYSQLESIYTTPSDVDVEASGDFFPENGTGSGGVYLPPVSTGNEQIGNGQAGGMSVLIPSLQQQQQQEHFQASQQSPQHQHQHQSPPLQCPQPHHQQQQQLFTLEQLNGIRTSMASNDGNLAMNGSQPGTPQQQPQMAANGGQMFSPAGPMGCQQNGGGQLLSDQQQQYLLAAAAFGPPPGQMPMPMQMGHFMQMGNPPAPDTLPPGFYHPAPPAMMPFSPMAMHPTVGHHYQNGQPISQ